VVAVVAVLLLPVLALVLKPADHAGLVTVTFFEYACTATFASTIPKRRPRLSQPIVLRGGDFDLLFVPCLCPVSAPASGYNLVEQNNLIDPVSQEAWCDLLSLHRHRRGGSQFGLAGTTGAQVRRKRSAPASVSLAISSQLLEHLAHSQL